MTIKDSRSKAKWPKHQVWGGVFVVTQVHVHIFSFTARDLGPLTRVEAPFPHV